MSATLTNEVLEDNVAMFLARAIAAANKRAREFGVDISQSLITITQGFENGARWRVSYGPKDYFRRRGGDLIVEVDAADASVKHVRRGQ